MGWVCHYCEPPLGVEADIRLAGSDNHESEEVSVLFRSQCREARSQERPKETSESRVRRGPRAGTHEKRTSTYVHTYNN
jgi:hypothetical protein